MNPLLFLAYLLASFIIAFWGRYYRFGFWGYFFACLLFSPVFGALLVIASQPVSPAHTQGER